MLNNYITNQGITKTIIHDNNNMNDKVNLVNWDMNYDGNMANIHVKNNMNGKCKSYDISMDNNGLEQILNMPTINIPIDKRLKNDFYQDLYQLKPYNKKTYKNKKHHTMMTPTMMTPTIINRYIASPQENEEFIIPLNINSRLSENYTNTPNKRHKRRRTHNTHKIYVKRKSKNSYKPKRNSRKRRRRINNYKLF